MESTTRLFVYPVLYLVLLYHYIWRSAYFYWVLNNLGKTVFWQTYSDIIAPGQRILFSFDWQLSYAVMIYTFFITIVCWSFIPWHFSCECFCYGLISINRILIAAMKQTHIFSKVIFPFLSVMLQFHSCYSDNLNIGLGCLCTWGVNLQTIKKLARDLFVLEQKID